MSLPMGATGNKSGLKGTGYKQIQTPTMSPEQQGLFRQLLGGSQEGISSGLSHLSGLSKGDPSQFEQMEAPAFRQFAGLQGSIASRFSGFGSGARRSSGFKNTMNEASNTLAERLQSNRLNMQNEAIEQLLGLGNSLLGKQTFETNFIPRQKNPSFLKQILGSLISGVSSGGAAALGSGFGAWGNKDG